MGQLFGLPGGVLLDRGCCGQFVLLSACHHIQRGVPAAIEAAIAGVFHETVLDRRDVAERQSRTVRIGSQNEIRIFPATINLAFGPEPDIAAYRTYRSTRRVHGRVANRLRYLRHRQAILA